MSRTRFDIAKKDILSFFENNPRQVFLRTDIGKILNENRNFWRLAQSTTREKFIDLLLQKTPLKATELQFPNKCITIFSWGDPGLGAKLSAIKRNCYLSHYTAVSVHSLTKQIPNVYYLTSELQYSKKESDILTQVSIDEAFSKEVRETKNCAEIDDALVCLLYGKFTNNSGVLYLENLGISVTNIERTLIDIAVRPNYSGGIYEVLEAYKNALGIVSVNKMAGLFLKMNYLYPYHQSIGFLLQRAGCKEHLYNLFKKFPIQYDFYLHHNIKNKSYSQEWHLYYPKGF